MSSCLDNRAVYGLDSEIRQMLGEPAGKAPVLFFLARVKYLVIDQHHQRRGYGKSAMKQTIAQLCEKPDCDRVQDPLFGLQY